MADIAIRKYLYIYFAHGFILGHLFSDSRQHVNINRVPHFNFGSDMNQSGIPDAVKRFILLFIPSVPYLEALLILRNQAEHLWDAAEIAPQLYLNHAAAQSLLDELFKNGLLSVDDFAPDKFRYQPKTQEMALMIDQLATIYSHNLIEITHLIHAKLNKKAHKFANAFIWGKDT